MRAVVKTTRIVKNNIPSDNRGSNRSRGKRTLDSELTEQTAIFSGNTSREISEGRNAFTQISSSHEKVYSKFLEPLEHIRNGYIVIARIKHAAKSVNSQDKRKSWKCFRLVKKKRESAGDQNWRSPFKLLHPTL